MVEGKLQAHALETQIGDLTRGTSLSVVAAVFIHENDINRRLPLKFHIFQLYRFVASSLVLLRFPLFQSALGQRLFAFRRKEDRAARYSQSYAVYELRLEARPRRLLRKRYWVLFYFFLLHFD